MKKILGLMFVLVLSSKFAHAADFNGNMNSPSDQLFFSIGGGYDLVSFKASDDIDKKFYEGNYLGVNGKIGFCAGDGFNYCGALVGSYSWDQTNDNSLLLDDDFKADNVLKHFGGEFGMGVVTPMGVGFNPYIAVGYSWHTADIDPEISNTNIKSELSGLTYGAGVDLKYDMGTDMYIAANVKYLTGKLEGNYKVGAITTDLDDVSMSVINLGMSIGFNF